MTMVGVLLPFGLRRICRREGLTTGAVRNTCRHRVTARGLCGDGGAWHCWPVDRPRHACAPRMFWRRRGAGLWKSGCGSKSCAGGRRGHRVTARGRFWFLGGPVAVCFEGGCEGMCWPVAAATHGRGSGSPRGFEFFVFCSGGGQCCWTMRSWSYGAGHLRRDGTSVKALLPFVPAAVAGARRRLLTTSGHSAAVPPQERWHEGQCAGPGRASWRSRLLTTGVVICDVRSGRRRGLRRCCRLFRGRLREWGEVVDHGSGHAAPCHLRRDGTRVKALLPFVLRAVAGACVGRWTGQPRMPPRRSGCTRGFNFLVWTRGMTAVSQRCSGGALIFCPQPIVPPQERWHEGVG